MMLGTCKGSLERRSEIWKECHRMWGRSCTASHKVRKELFFFFQGVALLGMHALCSRGNTLKYSQPHFLHLLQGQNCLVCQLLYYRKPIWMHNFLVSYSKNVQKITVQQMYYNRSENVDLVATTTKLDTSIFIPTRKQGQTGFDFILCVWL